MAYKSYIRNSACDTILDTLNHATKLTLPGQAQQPEPQKTLHLSTKLEQAIYDEFGKGSSTQEADIGVHYRTAFRYLVQHLKTGDISTRLLLQGTLKPKDVAKTAARELNALTRGAYFMSEAVRGFTVRADGVKEAFVKWPKPAITAGTADPRKQKASQVKTENGQFEMATSISSASSLSSLSRDANAMQSMSQYPLKQGEPAHQKNNYYHHNTQQENIGPIPPVTLASSEPVVKAPLSLASLTQDNTPSTISSPNPFFSIDVLVAGSKFSSSFQGMIAFSKFRGGSSFAVAGATAAQLTPTSGVHPGPPRSLPRLALDVNSQTDAGSASQYLDNVPEDALSAVGVIYAQETGDHNGGVGGLQPQQNRLQQQREIERTCAYFADSKKYGVCTLASNSGSVSSSAETAYLIPLDEEERAIAGPQDSFRLLRGMLAGQVGDRRGKRLALVVTATPLK